MVLWMATRAAAEDVPRGRSRASSTGSTSRTGSTTSGTSGTTGITGATRTTTSSRRTARRLSLQQVLAAARLDILSNSSPASFLGHSLRVSEVETRGAVLFCTACGAYAWSAPRALMRWCAGRALSPGRAAQRSRLARHEFPSGKKRGWQLGPARPPSPAVLQYLSDTAGRRSVLGARSPSATAIGGPYHGLSRAELLRYYGLTEASLRALAEKTRQIEEARKAGPREPLDPEYFEWQSSGDESKSSDLP